MNTLPRHAALRAARRPLLGALLALVLPMGMAQPAFPSKPMKIVSPFSPGSGVDAIARIYGRHLGDVFNVPVVVENKEGAGGMIGSAYAARLPADGHHLLVATNPFVVAPLTVGNASYDPQRDFKAVARVAVNPLLLVVNPEVPARTVKELIAYAKAHPGKLTYASSGPGTPSQLEMEHLKAQLGIDIREIAYKSNAQALTDTLGGTVSMYYTVQSTSLTNVRAGKLRALGVGSLQATQALPDVPPMAEAAGLPGYESLVWYGLVVPAGTPADVIRSLNQAIVKVSQRTEIREEVVKLGIEMAVSSAADFETTMQQETQKTQALTKLAKPR